MVQPHGLSKKKKKNPIYGLPIHQVKQKLKSEKEKPNIKKKISSIIKDQRIAPLPQTRAIKLIGHRQSDWRSVIASPLASWIGDRNSTDRIGDSFLADLASRLDVLPSLTAPSFSFRPPCSLNLKVFHLFFSLILSFSLMGFLS